MSDFSQDFILLESRIEALKKKFMDAQLQGEKDDPISFLPDLEFCAAYKLLVHAEIQDYLEKKARAGLNAIDADVKANGLNTSYYKTIIAIVLPFLGDLNIKLTHPFNEKDFKEAVKVTIDKARYFINNNNGIKNKSFTILSIMSCSFKDPFDSVLIANLDSYGKARGDVAHKSVSSVTSINSPMSEVGYVEQIMDGFKSHFYGVDN
jgi:hypothetical protein